MDRTCDVVVSRSFARLIPVAVLLALGLVGCEGQVGADTGPLNISNGDATASTDGGDAGTVEGSGKTGAPCSSKDDCEGGACVTGNGFEGGYCTTVNCEQKGCNGSDARCVDFQNGGKGCVDGCSSHQDCREGYSCRLANPDGTRACLPGNPPPPADLDNTLRTLGVKCNPEQVGTNGGDRVFEFEFSIDDDVDGFMMIPFVASGEVKPTELLTPETTVDIENDYIHHNSRLQDFFSGSNLTGTGTYGKIGFDWPVLVPFAPKHTNYVVPGGDYKLTIESTDEQPCVYVVGNEYGTKLDLNVYLVGANGLTATTAPDDPDLSTAISHFRHLYGKVGIDLANVRYYDMAPSTVEQYRRIRSREDAQKLTAYGRPPGEDREGHLSVDVFLVDDLQVTRGGRGNVLGMSTGIPGASGMHGNARNGVVFQTTDLGESNKHVGLIMAHEVGHYLGLRHTTEIVHGSRRAGRLADTIGTTDPIDATPVCEDIYDKAQGEGSIADCEDFQNLMFPSAPPPFLSQDVRLLDEQGLVLRANPTIHE